jgi:hypothetical protein
MPETLTHSAERLVISRAIVDLMRVSFGYRDQHAAFASNADEVLVAYAVLIGTLEGRPLNASKLAQMIGLPRSTTLRRLEDLEGLGVVHKRRGACYEVPIGLLNSPEIISMVMELSRIFVSAAAKLSKMDTKPLDLPETKA